MKLKIAISILSLFVAELNAKDLHRILNLEGAWKFTIGDRQEFAESDYDDEIWESIKVPGAWENQGFNGYDGHAWYRKTFDGSKLRNEEHIYLNLGYIDDSDQVYINGKLVGLSGGFPPDFYTAYTALRLYYIPKELINHQGENVISVRVFDVVHGGGIISGNIGLYAPRENFGPVVILEGIWRFSYGDNPAWKDVRFNDDDWEPIMVPAFWGQEIRIKEYYQKQWGKTTFGWYRRTFRIDNLNTNSNLTLVVGKIDDFDEVYINGKLIGQTNDGGSLGSSDSWYQMRVYNIPPGLLDPEKDNLIAVRVTDIGGNAGIYEGPVAILRDDYVARLIRSFK